MLVMLVQKNELALQSSISDDSLAQVVVLTSLRELSLRGCVNLVGPGIHLPPFCTLLLHPSCGWEGTPRAVSQCLCDLPMSGSTDAVCTGLRHLRALTALRSLNLRGCTALTNRGLDHVAGMAGLKGLNLWECTQITNDGLRRLEAMRGLESIVLGRCNGITDKGLSSLARMPSRDPDRALAALCQLQCPRIAILQHLCLLCRLLRVLHLGALWLKPCMTSQMVCLKRPDPIG